MAMKMGHSFPKEFGFTGSSGAAPVKGYMRGGAVKRDPSTQVRDMGRGENAARMPKSPSEKGEFARGGHHKMAGGGKHWIAGATKNKGALHRALGVPEGKKIPAAKMRRAEHAKSGKVRKEAALAETLKGMHHKRGGMKKFAVGGVVSAGEYAVPKAPSPMYKYARGGRVATAGPKSPTQMSGYPKVASRYSVPPTRFEKYARGGMKMDSPVRPIPKANDSNEKWADYKRGGMKHKRGGGRC
jgi:hypothetical protein